MLLIIYLLAISPTLCPPKLPIMVSLLPPIVSQERALSSIIDVSLSWGFIQDANATFLLSFFGRVAKSRDLSTRSSNFTWKTLFVTKVTVQATFFWCCLWYWTKNEEIYTITNINICRQTTWLVLKISCCALLHLRRREEVRELLEDHRFIAIAEKKGSDKLWSSESSFFDVG